MHLCVVCYLYHVALAQGSVLENRAPSGPAPPAQARHGAQPVSLVVVFPYAGALDFQTPLSCCDFQTPALSQRPPVPTPQFQQLHSGAAAQASQQSLTAACCAS